LISPHNHVFAEGVAMTDESTNAREAPENAASALSVRVFRFDPTVDAAPRYETYQVPRQPRMRVLDALDYIACDLAVDIGYRWYCGAKKCGTCAVTVNGVPTLACWEPALPEMTVEPLKNLPVVRDLVTERGPYEEILARFSPTLHRDQPYQRFPEPLSHREMASGDRLRDCIQCLACYAACPVIGDGDRTFAGPAPLVKLAELTLDPRDSLDRGTVAQVHADVFKCISCYACEEVCPAEIPIVSHAIEPLKREAHRAGAGKGSRHASAFLDLVCRGGRLDASAVVLKTHGVSRALLDWISVGIRMLRHGKISPVRLLTGAVKRRLAPPSELERLLKRAVRGTVRAAPGRTVRPGTKGGGKTQ